MSESDFSSSVAAPPPGWARPFPRDERLFLGLVLASVVAMTVISIAWLSLGRQNVPTHSYATTPRAYAAQVSAMVNRYGASDGRVYVPPGHDVYLMASRFTWYPEVVLQRGRPYRMWLSSVDVLHGFSLVAQNINLEVVPGHAMGVDFTPGAPGRYLVVCNELCGAGHANMSGRIDVVPASVMRRHVQPKARA